jgi:hypothetical protein
MSNGVLFFDRPVLFLVLDEISIVYRFMVFEIHRATHEKD